MHVLIISVHTRNYCCMCALFFTMLYAQVLSAIESVSPEAQSQMPKVKTLINRSVHGHILECLTSNVDGVSHLGFALHHCYVLGTSLDTIDKANGINNIAAFKEEK